MGNKAIWFFFLFSFFLSSNSLAQISRTEPAEPRWGEKLTIIYDTTARGAKLAPEDEIYAAIRMSYPGFAENTWARMLKSGPQFKCEIAVKQNLSGVAIHFITPNGGWDDAAYTTAIVYRADGKPARGALESKIRSWAYREFFEKELALYPDNYSAYRAKWATASLLEVNGGMKIVWTDMEKHLRDRTENAELLCALSTGNLMLGREARSRELIRRAYEKFPDNVFTAAAISDYERMVAEIGLPNSGLAEIAKIKKAILTRNPQTEFARSASTALAEESNAPPDLLDLIESISVQWMSAAPDHPLAWFNLAREYERQYQKPERGSQLIEKAIELLRGGKLRLYGDVNGKQTERLLLTSYVIKAELASRQGNNDLALQAIATAKQLSPENDPRAYLLEARILRAMNQDERAENAFVEAWRRGSQEAEERLKAIYRESRGSLQDFDEYLLAKGKAEKKANDDWKLPAPQFKVSSLDGKTFDLKSLRGKIVVLNMWFIACGPCRKEIPKLNEVVREFKNKEVVFLAPTPDFPDSLKSFLKTMPFEYSIVPEADRILDQFNVAHFPTHILIDREGQVEIMMVGARERAPEEVRRILLKLTGAQVEQR